MPWQANPYTLPLIFGGTLSLVLAAYGWQRRRSVPGAAFASLMLGVTLWSIAYGLELGTADVATKLLWANVQYFGIVAVPTSWVVFALQNAGRGHLVTPRLLALLALEPLATLVLAWTSDAHSLFRTSNHLVAAGSFAFLVSEKGPAFWAHAGYSYVLLLIGTVLILQTVRTGPRFYRGQSVMVLAAALAPSLANVLYLSGANPFAPLDISPFSFILTGLLMAGGMLRYGLLDIVPVARERVVEEMGDGVVVLDAQARVVDVNPAARRIIGPAAADAIGRPASVVLAAWPGLLQRYRDVLEARDEVAVGEGPDRRVYELKISPLRDARGRLKGRVIAWRDVTGHARAEDALRRQSEFLASLHETALAIMNRLDLEPLLEALVARAAGLVEAPNGFLYLETPDGSVLENRVWLGSKPMDRFAAPREGAVGRVWHSGEPLAIDDYDTWEGRSSQVPGGIFGSMVTVPLRLGGRVAGGLGLAYDHGSERRFGDAEVRLLASFAQLASIALDNARLFEQEYGARAQAERLQAATRALTATVELKTVFDLILSELEKVVPSDSASIQELKGDRLEIIGARGHAARFIGHSFDLAAGDGRSREVLARQEPVIREAAPYVDGLLGTDAHAGLRSWMGVPLQFGDRVIGLLVLNKAEPGSYGAEHATRAWAFAAQAAIAIENARLYGAARQELAERKLAQDKLERSEARYRDLFEQSLGLICTHDREGRLLSVNPAAAADLGYTAEEMVGHNMREFLAPAVRDRFDTYLATLESRHSAAGTMRIEARNGEERLWRYRNVLRETPEGAHVIGFAQDVTDEALAQRALRDSEERFRQLAENIDAVFWMRSVEPGRFLYLSPAYERIWGRSRETLMEDPTGFLDTVHPEDRPALEAYQQEESPGELEFRIVRPDGTIRWIRARGFPVRDKAGAVRRIAGVSEDVTELKAAAALREDVTRTMVHDLRSPLTVIKGFLDLLEATGATLAEPMRAMHQTATHSSAKLLRLIDSILDVSRLENGAMPLEPRRVHVRQLASEVIDAESYLGREKELHLANEVPDDLPPAWADADLLARVLQNLVGNAVKFTPRGGSVRVAACCDGAADAPCLRVSVVDTGAGIPAALRGRLFQTFVTGQQAGRGSGVGLAFCRLAVEAQGGRIWCEDGPNAGAAFHFTLPLAAPSS